MQVSLGVRLRGRPARAAAAGVGRQQRLRAQRRAPRAGDRLIVRADAEALVGVVALAAAVAGARLDAHALLLKEEF